MNAPRAKPPRLTLEDLIDLEMQFQEDRDRDSQDLRRRDAEIGQRIDAPQLAAQGQDRALFLAWLRQQRGSGAGQPPSPGRQIQLLLEIVGLVLILLGLGIGFGAVTGWLRMDPTEPVNAIFFWAVIIGLQDLLLCVWLVAVLPTTWLRRLPGAEAFQMLLRWIARALPLAVTWVAARMSAEHRVLLARLRGTLQSWSWVYGRIRLWKLIALTQVFAVAYNVGAILAFVGISYGNDPAFGWKSRLLTGEELHGIVRTLALPWSSFWPAAAPTLQHIELTRFSSLDPRYAETFESRVGEVDAWLLWWPFLLACLLFYGLLPRILTLSFSQWRLRRALAAVKLDHGDFYKLKDRLTRPLVETQATAPEVGADASTAPERPATVRRPVGIETPPARATKGKVLSEAQEPGPLASGRGSVAKAQEPSHASETPPAPPLPSEAAPLREEAPPEPAPVAVSAPVEKPRPAEPAPAPSLGLPARQVVQWAGVNLTPDDVSLLVRQRLGVAPGAVFTVGDLQGKGDDVALAALEGDGQGEVLMVVESWEPPIADYMDFLSDVRGAVGRERMIVVLLYNRDPQGQAVPPRPRDVQVWRDQIATLGDPWMCVEELVERRDEALR